MYMLSGGKGVVGRRWERERCVSDEIDPGGIDAGGGMMEYRF